MILADTSVWVDHFKTSDSALVDLLEAGGVVCHPFIIGELACGGIQNRPEILSLLSALRSTTKAGDDEIPAFIARNDLMGRGLGLIDIHLLASCKLDGVLLWTRDAELRKAAEALRVGAEQK